MGSPIEARVIRREGEPISPDISVAFSGQGTQHLGMGRDVFEGSPRARDVFELADKLAGFTLSKLCFEGPAEELNKLANSQLAIFTVGMAEFTALLEKAPTLLERVRFITGHSFGQYLASVAAGVLEFPDAFRAVSLRGTSSQKVAEEVPSAMTAVRARFEQLRRLEQQFGQNIQGILDNFRVKIAAYNSPEDYTISGERKNVEEVEKLLKSEGIGVLPLSIGAGFHHLLMDSVGKAVGEFLNTVGGRPPIADMILNKTGLPSRSPLEIKADLSEGHVEPVRWDQMVATMAAHGVKTVLSIEIGSKQVLPGLVRKIDSSLKTARIANFSSIQNFNLAGV